MTAPIYSYVSQLGIDSANPVTKRFDFKSCGIGVNEEFIDTSGNRGTRSRGIERVRGGLQRVAGTISLQPTAVEWSYLLPWILGANASGTTYALADALQSRYVTVDKSDGTNGKVMTYDHCLVNRATIRGQQGQPLDLELDVVGVAEAVANAGTFPALSLDTTTWPFVFHDLTFVINGSTVSAKNVEITIDNHVDVDRFFNSATLSTAANAMDRHITLNTLLPYGDWSALYNTGSGGVAAAATFAYNATSLLFDFVKIAFPRRPIEVPERQEEMLPLQGTAYASASTKELVCTLDSTP